MLLGSKRKEGELKLEKDFDINNFLIILINSKQTTSYKYFFLKQMFILILNDQENISFNNLFLLVATDYLETIVKKDNKISSKEKESKLYKKIEKIGIQKLKIDKTLIANQKLNFLENYVLGALYEDSLGKIFGFSKKNKIINFNIYIKKMITQETIQLIENLIDIKTDSLDEEN